MSTVHRERQSQRLKTAEDLRAQRQALDGDTSPAARAERALLDVRMREAEDQYRRWRKSRSEET